MKFRGFLFPVLTIIIGLENAWERVRMRKKTLILINLLICGIFSTIFVMNVSSTNGTITYSSGVITVDGTYTDVFESIYQADQSGGWDVFTKTGNNMYACNNTRIDFGDGVNETVVSDSLCSVNFFGGSDRAFRVRNNATANFGILIDETEKTTRDGVSFVIEGYSYVTLDVGSVTNFYGCSIESDENVEIDFKGSGKIYHSSFTSGYYMIVTYDGSDYEFYDMYVAFDYEVAFEPHETHEMDKITVVESPYNVKIHYMVSSGITVRNLCCRRASSDNIWIELAGTSNRSIYFVDADLDEWSIKWSRSGDDKLYRQYTFDLTMFFKNGSEVENANVTISNDYLGSNSWLTFTNGSIPSQTYSMGYYNVTGNEVVYNYNPYNLTVTLDEYQTYTTLFNITQKTDLTIALTPTQATTEPTEPSAGGVPFKPSPLVLIERELGTPFWRLWLLGDVTPNGVIASILLGVLIVIGFSVIKALRKKRKLKIAKIRFS